VSSIYFPLLFIAEFAEEKNAEYGRSRADFSATFAFFSSAALCDFIISGIRVAIFLIQAAVLRATTDPTRIPPH
jgi:hypothetical protein